MENLFDENEDSSFSLFSARNKIKQEQIKNKNQNESELLPKQKKILKPQNHFRCSCYLHSFNQANNETKEIGMFDIKVMKQEFDFFLIFISQKTHKEFSKIICNKETHWIYCNENKCILNIPNIGDVEIEFINMMDAKILTIIVLSVKAKQYGNLVPIKILSNDNEDITKPIDLLTVNFNKIPIEILDIKEDFIPAKDSLQEKFSTSKGPGSIAVIALEDNTFGFLEVKSIKNNTEVDEIIPKSNDKISIIENKEFEEEEEGDNIEQKLDDLQSEMNILFDQTALMLIALKPKHFEYGTITVSDEKMIYDIQAAINAYEYKEDKLAEFQAIIDKYDDTLTESEEKRELQSLIKETNGKINAEEDIISHLTNDIKSLTETIHELQKLKDSQDHQYKTKEKEIIDNNRTTILNYKTTLDHEISLIKGKLQQIQQSTESLTSQLNHVTQSNSTLRSHLLPDTRLTEFDALTRQKLKSTISSLTQHTFSTISHNVNSTSLFTGRQIKSAVQRSLTLSARSALTSPSFEEEEEEYSSD